MPGFEFRYRIGGGRPTVRALPVHDARTLTAGDMLNVVDDAVALGATGDRALVGAAVEIAAGDGHPATIRTIVDADAVYGVEDPHARSAGTGLALTGPTGAQGVAATHNGALSVVVDCSVEEETLVRIHVGCHRAPAPAPAPAEQADRPTGGELNAAIARAVVRAHREHTGRGPTRAQAFYRGNVVVVVMHDAMTKVESRLVAQGKAEVVLEFRRAFQETMRADVVAAVEALTGCRVEAFMSDNHVAPDMAGELFVLDRPVPGEGGGAAAGDLPA
jgi:uncharacterized protein YbcI